MNNLTTQTVQTMSSLEIAKLTEKEHFNVLRDIKKVLDEVGIDALKFEGVYKAGNGEERPCFNLPRRECDFDDLTTELQSDKTALAYRV